MKNTIVLLFALVCCIPAFSQRDIDEESWSIKDRGYVGIGLSGLGFGTSPGLGRYFTVGVSPQVGYMITKNFSTGLGFEYQYTNLSDLKIQDHLYGWFPFLRYNIKSFFIQTDYDWFSIDNPISVENDREIHERFFVGAGYSSPAGRRGYFNLMLSYDFLYTNTSAFSSPLSLRAFVTF